MDGISAGLPPSGSPGNDLGVDLADAVVLVTGGSGGIGAACAAAAAGRGAAVIVAGRDEARLAAVGSEVGGKALMADLTRPGAAEELAAAAEAVHGRVDVVVHCAGRGWKGPTAAMPPNRLDELIDLNVRAPMRLSQALLPGMVQRHRGHFVYLASVAGWTGVREEAVYAATKAALLIYAESLRAEHARSGLGVSVVSPGGVETEFFERRGEPYGRQFPRQLAVAEVAEAVIDAVEHGRPHRMMPRWLGAAPAMRATAPRLYRALLDRFG